MSDVEVMLAKAIRGRQLRRRVVVEDLRILRLSCRKPKVFRGSPRRDGVIMRHKNHGVIRVMRRERRNNHGRKAVPIGVDQKIFFASSAFFIARAGASIDWG